MHYIETLFRAAICAKYPFHFLQVTLDKEGLTEGEFEEAKRIASDDSALNQSFEAPGYGTEDVLGIAAGVVGLLIIVW